MKKKLKMMTEEYIIIERDKKEFLDKVMRPFANSYKEFMELKDKIENHIGLMSGVSYAERKRTNT